MASSSFSLLLFPLLFTAATTIIITTSEAKSFLVGGSTHGWSIPSSPSDSLNKWAESTRFHIGDSLEWKYDGNKDAVLQVTRKDYLSCNTSGPIADHKDGHTVVRLHRPGPYYFIGGAKGACEKGERLIVVVMSPRKFSRIAPAPSPATVDGPAVAPTSAGLLVKVKKGWGLVGPLLAVMGMFWL